MGSPELAQYADFYADTTRRFGLTNDLERWRDISERLHQLTSEPEDVTYRDVTANGVPAILVMPAESSPDHILLHSHSGGGVTASMWQERKAVGHLAKAAGARALVINYRLAPEDKFPAQIDDVEAAYRWLLGQGYDPSRIASSGDSIGGNFAVNLALTLQRKNAPLPGAVLSMSPWFDMELKNESIDTNASVDKMLSRDLLRGFSDSMLDGTGIAVTDPRINLAYADPEGLPPTMPTSSPSGLARPASTWSSDRCLRDSTTSSWAPGAFRRSTRQSPRWAHGYGPRSDSRCQRPERPAAGSVFRPGSARTRSCSAGRDADLCDSQICQASNGKENTMRAVTVTEYGATPAVAEMPTPQPGPGQVLIRLRAAGMNPMDRALASGAWKPMPA